MTSLRWPLKPPGDAMQETGVPTGPAVGACVEVRTSCRVDVGCALAWGAIRDYHVEAIYTSFW